MKEVADCIVETCSTQTLIDEKLLVPVRYFEPTVKSPDGKRMLVGDPLDHYMSHARGRPSIAFCVSNEFARAEAERFRSAGLRTMAIEANSDTVMREQAEKGLQSGALDIVFNCKLWTAGIDVPAVSCILDMRGTNSLVDFLQGGGRGFRTHPGKDDLIYLDMVGNRERHGDITAERAWTLEGAAEGSGRVVQEMPVKSCPQCFATLPSMAIRCSCGHVFQAKPRVIDRIDGELREVEAVKAAIDKKAQSPTSKQQTLNELIAIAHARGKRRPELWARAVYMGRIKQEARNS
jgi:superfamily II DNA or RNA helicase